MINLKSNYNRIFAFGCSYTRHIYATYADIIASQYPNATFINLGQSGSGNQLLLSRLSQTHRILNINEDDLVIIMYPSVTREDRWLPTGTWHTAGNIFHHKSSRNVTFNAFKFYKSYGSFLHYLIRDFAIIDMVENFLQNLTCDKILLTSTPLILGEELNDGSLVLIEDDNIKHYNKLLKTYKDLLESYPIDYQTFFKVTYLNNGIPVGVKAGDDFDAHPSPIQALGYLKTIMNVNELGVNYANRQEQLINNCKSMEDVKMIHRDYNTELDKILQVKGFI